MSRFAWTVSGIAQETKLWVPMKEFPDWITGRGTLHPICGWHLLWTGALAWIKRRKWAFISPFFLIEGTMWPVTSRWLSPWPITQSHCEPNPNLSIGNDKKESPLCSWHDSTHPRGYRKENAVLVRGPKGSAPNVRFSCLTKMLKRCWPSTTHLSQTKSNSTGKEEVLSRACGPPWSAICTQVARRD